MIEALAGLEMGIEEILRQGARRLVREAIEAKLAALLLTVEKLQKDHNALLSFYDSPAKHWLHIRSSHVIESIFATVRRRSSFLGLSFTNKITSTPQQDIA